MCKKGRSCCIAVGARVNLSWRFSFLTKPTDIVPFSEVTFMRLTVLR